MRSERVAGVIMEETGQSFGQLMKSGYSLADVLEILYNSVDQDSEALMNLWGSAEAGKAANAVINQGLDTFNNNLDKLRNSAGTTERAYSAMTNTTQYATERMQNSFNNLAIAIGDDINPTVAQFKNGIADITDGFTELITKHPAISALLTGAAVGIGGVTLALTAYTAVTKVATVVTAAMGTTMSVALGPLALVAAAIGGVTAAVIYLNNTEDEMAKAQENLTLSSKETQKELDKLQDQYAELEEAGQADAVAAYELKNQIDELSASFEENKETIADLVAQTEELRTALDEIDSKYEETMSVQGQYDLWTEVEDVTAMTSQSIKDALQSQIDYWNSYNENMNSLTARADEIEGLSDMLKDLSDGSEESAAMLAGMESMNDADLSAVVKQYNDLQTAQGDTATSMAELETDFSNSLTKIQTDMETAVDNLNLSDEAKANAKSTMDAYVKEIQDGVSKAQSAINSLSFANTTLKGGGYHAYAEGTVDAEPGLALVGEEGPELVKELFRGIITSHKQSNSKKLVVKAYDNAYYLANNKDSFCYTNKTATDIFNDCMSRLGMTGEAVSTGYVIPELPKASLAVNGKYIRGFGVPKYDKEASVKPATPAAPSAPATKKNYVLKNGSAKVGYATSRNNSLAGTYVTTSDLNMRTGAGTGNTVILTLLEGAEVKCYGYYSTKDGVKWYLVAIDKYAGFVHSKWLKKK